MKINKFLLVCCLSIAASAANGADLQGVLNQIEQLENKSDPKCYATASRLEDFMFGTPLSDNARFSKHQAEKLWLKQLWQIASQMAYSEGAEEINEQVVERALEQYFAISQDEKGHWLLKFNIGNQIKIHKDDKRQYGSIAYSLRALLAVQQESLLDLDSDNLPLNQEAINALTNGLDLFSLSALKVADQQARNDDKFEVDKATIDEVWQMLMGEDGAGNSAVAQKSAKPIPQNLAPEKLEPVKLTLLSQIVEQKVRSYAAYNQISNQLFVRNLQVYFARNRWPTTDEEGKLFRQTFTETLIAFAADLYKGAEAIALADGRRLMNEADVSQFAAQFVPHNINEYEDAIFFPKLPRAEQVTIESYDMDAFRDSGIHWRYLQFAVFDSAFKAYVEPDPFAAELLVENIAQFGVLILRMTGNVGKAKGEKRISTAHFAEAMKQVQQRVADHNSLKDVAVADISFSSSASAVKSASPDKKGSMFSEVTQASGIDYMHRSSDWLNRLLRSYLRTGDNTATSVIPPAFGGSGVAAEDINNDGLVDVLILGGVGNRLYLNLGDGSFKDITKEAGLGWVRDEDNQPGEARQPLIADLNNDGLQDIVISYVNDAHRVYQNLGDAKFKDVTDGSGLGGQGLVGGPATVFDYDNDGLLDIYITYFGDYLNGVLPTLKRRNDNGLPNKLFKNTGNFKFVDVTKGSNLDNTGWGQAVTHADFNNDGLQDLIVGNDFGVNAYYKNLGKGKFIDVAKYLGADKPSYTMGIGSADLNDDLIPDIYISNIVTMNKDEKYVMPGEETTMKFNPEKLAKMRVVEANDLFISTKDDSQGPNDGINYHLSEAIGRGYSSTGWSWDADFFDSDNDGDDDLYVLNGMNEFNLYSSENPYYTDPLKNAEVNVYIPVATKESNVFFVNDGGKLNNVSKESGIDLVGNSRAAVFFDFEGDGDLDMVLNNYHEKAVVYRNNAQKLNHNWLKVSLEGAPKQGVNLDAIGAQIIVTTEDGDSRWRLVQGSTGYMSVHPKLQHFGLQK